MPNVGGVEYPYTPEGVAAAQEHARQIQMSPPMTSPSHPMAQRQVPDLQSQRLAHYTAPYFPENLPREPGFRNVDPAHVSPSFYQSQRQVPDLQPYNPAPIQGRLVGDGILSSLGYSSQNMPSKQELGNVMQYGHRGVHAPSGHDLFDFSEMRSTPSSPWYQPVAPAPRGNVIETSGPANYGSSPSNPNWGQDTGGRSIQKMGPQMLPVSARTQAISPQNRINANIRAVMSGQQGPSPGTSPTGQAPARPPSYKPWQNQFGPTGQPVSRTPLQKDNMVNNVVKQLPGG